jgi:hypothetical protein
VLVFFTLMLQRIAIIFCLAALLSGCASRPRQVAPSETDISLLGLRDPYYEPAVDAVAAPPVGWKAEPFKNSDRHTHQVWLSPTGNTAYGIIWMKLPIPLGQDLVHWVYMREMRKSEGDAILINKKDDPELPGIRFEAEGGLYRTRNNLLVYGNRAWVFYAGTLRNKETDEVELDLAVRAREHSVVGHPADNEVNGTDGTEK